ncbi:hypothetical protein GCM10027442_39210 [Emticicia fontis]
MKEKIDAIVKLIPSMTNPELLSLISPLIQEATKRGDEILKAIPHSATKVERSNILTLAAIGKLFETNN